MLLSRILVRKECTSNDISAESIVSTYAMSHGSMSFSASSRTFGYLHVESAALFFTPGIHLIRRIYRSVFSFRFLTRALGCLRMHSSHDLEQRFVVYCNCDSELVTPDDEQACSRASVTASASPSMDLYLACSGCIRECALYHNGRTIELLSSSTGSMTCVM